MNTPITALISIDRKKGRIRIHKESLRLIGNPKHVQFLVSVERGELALLGVDADSGSSGSIRIIPQLEADYDVHSTTLINKIVATFPVFDEICTYRITGVVLPEDHAIIFPVNTRQKVEAERVTT